MSADRRSLLAIFCAAALCDPAGARERIKDLASCRRATNQLVGYGIVVGLDGSGDQTTQTPFLVQSMISMLSAMGSTCRPGSRCN